MLVGVFKQPEMPLTRKLVEVNWGLVVVITVIASVGFGMLYSAANGNFDPWASRQMARFGPGLVLMVVLALVDLRFWLRNAYVVYFLALLMLAATEVVGSTGM